jgi:hypothetical protein
MATGYEVLKRGMGPAVAACLAGLLMAFPSIAGAATYPADPAARGFTGGAPGWTASSSFDGICAAPLLCPSVDNTFQASDGADGGGFIRSTYTGVAGVTAVGGTSTGIWRSAPFAYSGADGAEPTEVTFDMDRRASVDELLAVAGNSATYSVQLIDVTDAGNSVELIPPTSLAGANAWRSVPRVSVEADELELGHDYLISITSTYVTGTGVLVTGDADYDNVVLSADRDDGDGDGDGAGGGNGDGLDSDRLASLILNATPGTATLKTLKGARGKRLFVPVKCPRKVKRACRMTVQGLLTKRKPATTRRTVKVGRGKSKVVRLRVKPRRARNKVAKRKKLLVKQKVRAGKVTATVFKKRKLIRR